MYRLLILITFISGISTRGVPVADDTSGEHVEPKRTDTDNKDRSGEHVNLAECKDCIKVNRENEADVSISQDRKKDEIDDPTVSSQKAKPKTNRRIKPFLTFHRIKVKVNKESKARRKSRNKPTRNHHRKNSDVSSHISEPKDKSQQAKTEVSVISQRVATERDSKKPKGKTEVQIQDAETPTEASIQGPQNNTNQAVTDKMGNKGYDINNEDKQGTKVPDIQNLNPKQPLDKQTQDDIYIDEKIEPLNTITLNGSTNNDIVNGADEKDQQKSIVNLKDEKNSFDHTSLKPKEEKIAVDHDVETPKEKKNSVDQLVRKSKDGESSVNHSVVKPNDKKKITDYMVVDSNNSADHVVSINSNDDKSSVDRIVGVKPKSEKESAESIVKVKANDEKKSAESIMGIKPNDEKKSAESIVGIKPKDEKKYAESIVGIKPKYENDSTESIVKLKPKDGMDSAERIAGVKPKDEKGSIDRVIPTKARDRWSRKGLSQVPDVERLERRLHPTVDAPVKDIIQSMRNMLKLIQSSLFKVDVDYKMIHNTTRWKYMVGVRNQLTKLAEKNDEIYDVVMEASLLTKEIYRKAHERRHPQVNVEAMAVTYRSKLNTGMQSTMHTNFFAAQQELDRANQLLAQIKASRKQKESMNDEKIRLYHVVKDRLPLRSLHDLYRRADQTIRVLTTAQPLSRSGDKSLLYSHMRNDTTLNMKRAHELIAEGFDLLDHTQRVVMENKRKAQEHGKRLRNGLPAGAVADIPFDSGRMDLFVAWDTANHHANSLSDRAAEIHMKLVPLINKAKTVMASKKSVGFKKLLDTSTKQLRETVKTLSDVLDQIRLMFGDDGILTERCEVLQGAKYFLDTPISCDQYITIPDVTESSGDGDEGSGDMADTVIDMEITTSNVSDGEPAKDIDITKVNETDKVKENVTDHESASNIDDIDDEDRVQELKLKLTKKTSTTTKSPPTTATTTTTTTQPTTTEASEDSDGDLFFDTWGWFNDEPGSDSIVIDSDDDTGLLLIPENTTLNELIRGRLYSYSQDSQELLEAADATNTKMTDVSLTWQKVQKRFATLENKTLNAKSVVSKWKAENAYFKAVHDRVEGVNKDIKLKKGVIKAQCTDAVDKAKKKLKTMTEVYEKQSEKAENAADPTDVKEAVSQVKAVVDDVNEITRLKQLYPSPCGTLQSLDRKIRSNITELRKKIERAKLIASSIQIAVAVPKKEYLEFPISKESDERHPLTSHVQMMLKHSGSNGRLVSLHVGESESLSLEVKNDALTVVQSIDGDENSQSLYEDNIEDKWYLIQLQRFAASYNFTIFGDKGVLGKVGTAKSVDDLRAMTPNLLPSALRLGASGDLNACALGLEINGQSINMLDMGDNESISTLCSSQGRWSSHQHHLSLDGSGYALISLNDLPSIRTLQSVKVAFSPRSDGTVVFLQPRRMATTVDVYVDKGFLVVYVQYRRSETKLKSTVQVYNTEQHLEIVFKDRGTRGADIVLNGKSNVFKTAKGEKREIKADNKDISIGGIPMEDSSMVGCIKSIELNGEDIPFHKIYKAEGNHFGTCQKTECVKFDDSSIPVEFENLTEVRSIHISVKRGSLGPMLTFSKHKEKFNLTVSLNTEGLSIEETVGEKTEEMSLYGDSDFIVVAIQDDTKKKSVKVTVGDDTEEFSYKKGGWGWGGNGGDKKDDGPVSYSISLGTSSEDSLPFLGTIQNLIIDGRPVDLMNYVDANKLGRCMTDPAPRKADTPNADIQGVTCQ